MIVYDDVISLIQRTGGITVLFNEIQSRLSRDNIEYTVSESPDVCNTMQLMKIFERYRSIPASRIPADISVFHSTYYRVPSNKVVPVVTTVHDFTYERVVGGVRKMVHSWQKGHAINSSDHIICVSESTREDLYHYYPNVIDSHVTVVPNGVSSVYHPIAGVMKKQQVLFVGSRASYKNFNNTVESLIAHKDISLACVGGGGFSNAEILYLEQCIPGRYTHLGYISEYQLNIEYNQSICLVYPSLYEGFGIPVLEAFASGCPVIAVDTSSIPEVAGGAAVLIKSGASSEISDAISALSCDKVRSDFRDKGFSQVSKFSWERTYQETLRVYEKFQ